MDSFKIGDRVQYVDYATDDVFDGVVASITPPKRMKTNDYWRASEAEQAEMVTFVSVKWDDGTEEPVNEEELTPVDSTLEREFRLTYYSARDKIAEKLAKADKLIDEAVALSEEYGVPFSAYVSPLNNSYFPRSMEEKFPEIDLVFVSELTEASNEYGSGWEHSAVC